MCFSLFGYYVSIETIAYLERAMVTNAELEFEAEVSAVAVCFGLPLIIRLTNLSSPIFNNHIELDRLALLETHLYDKFSADFILNNTQSVNSLLFPLHGTYNQIEFLKDGYKCAEYTNFEGMQGKNSIVVNILINETYLPHIAIYAYQRSRKPRKPLISYNRPQHMYI